MKRQTKGSETKKKMEEKKNTKTPSTSKLKTESGNRQGQGEKATDIITRRKRKTKFKRVYKRAVKSERKPV